MFRTALKPRWLALLVVVLLAATGMAWLGQWQLDRARERNVAAERARLPRDPVELSRVLRARQTFPGSAADELIVATGHWDPEHQVLVTPRQRDGATGMWVLTPLRLADGSAVPVVRGWVSGPDDPAAVPPGEAEVKVTGRLRPSEPPADHEPGEGSGLPPGQVERIAVPLLVQQWPYPLLTGYVVQTAASPPAAVPAPRPVPAEPQGGGLALLNLSYALQWWLFAGFGLLLWWRLVRDDHQGRPILRRPADPGSAPDPPVGEDEAVPAASRRDLSR